MSCTLVEKTLLELPTSTPYTQIGQPNIDIKCSLTNHISEKNKNHQQPHPQPTIHILCVIRPKNVTFGLNKLNGLRQNVVIVRLGWRIPCRRRLLLRPLSDSPPKRRQWMQLSTTNLQCLTLLTLALPDNDPPPPPTEMVAEISLSPFFVLTFSLRNHPDLTFPLFSLHFLTSSASISPFSLFSFSLRNVQASLFPFSVFTFFL